MPEEQRRILEMLASQQITVEQADRLLEAVTPVPLRAEGRDRVSSQGRQRDARGRAPADGGAFLHDMRALGLRDLGPHDLLALKATGVDGAYVRDLRAHGLSTLEAHDLIALKSTGVDGAYIQDISDAGLQGLDAQDLIAFKAQGIDSAYVRRMRSAGFGELTPNDLIALKAAGIDADETDSEGGQPAGADTVELLPVGDEPEGEEDADHS